MGIQPGLELELIEATPYRLRYLMTATGGAGSVVLGNSEGASPDLRTDAQSAAVAGTLGLPLFEALSVPLDAGGAANQVQARNLLLEGGIHVQITPRDAPDVQWAVDADEGNDAGDAASAGFFVYVLDAPTASQGDTAYLDIKLRRTKDGGGVRIKP